MATSSIMEKVFSSVEDIIADERFTGWYFKTDERLYSEWETYVSVHPEIQSLADEAVLLLQQLSVEKELPTSQVASAEQRLLQSIRQKPQQAVVRRMYIKRGAWIAAAAVIILMLTGAAWWWQMNRPASVQANYGEVLEKILPDGTKVLLNAHSKISYACNWNEDAQREVWLKGEAFFHVTKTASKSRFIVHANEFDIIVTGTQFNVVSKEKTNSVMLTEGSIILVTKDGKELHMKPGDFAEMNNGIPEMKTVAEGSILAWRDRKLMFTDIPLKAAIPLIEEHYGITIKLKDASLGDKPLRGILSNDNLNVMLQSLEAAFGLKATRQGDVVTITGS